METDTYTKIVLTVIAVCLVSLVLKSSDSGLIVSNVQAQTSKGVADVNIVSIDGKGFSPLAVSPLGPALPVKVVTK